MELQIDADQLERILREAQRLFEWEARLIALPHMEHVNARHEADLTYFDDLANETRKLRQAIAGKAAVAP